LQDRQIPLGEGWQHQPAEAAAVSFAADLDCQSLSTDTLGDDFAPVGDVQRDGKAALGARWLGERHVMHARRGEARPAGRAGKKEGRQETGRTGVRRAFRRSEERLAPDVSTRA